MITIELNARNHTDKTKKTKTTKIKNKEFSRIILLCCDYCERKINCDVIILWFGKVARACCL